MYIELPFSNDVLRQNRVSSVYRSEEGHLILGIVPPDPAFVQPDHGGPSYPYEVVAIDPVPVQELGLPSCKVTYLVAATRCRYTDPEGVVHHVTLPTPGVMLRLRVSEAVLELTQRLLWEHRLDLTQVLALLRDLYGVRLPTGIAHYFRWKAGLQASQPDLRGSSLG